MPLIAEGSPRCPDRLAYGKSLLNFAAPAYFSLRDVQIDSVYSYEMFGGLFGPVGVGHGKTFITLLCGVIGIRKRGHQRAGGGQGADDEDIHHR